MPRIEGMRNPEMFVVGTSRKADRADVEDLLAVHGIEFEAVPFGSLVRYSVAGGEEVQREAQLIVRLRSRRPE